MSCSSDAASKALTVVISSILVAEIAAERRSLGAEIARVEAAVAATSHSTKDTAQGPLPDGSTS